MTGRVAIVVADDLGYDPAIDRGIREAHRSGVVTAASALVVGPFAEEALASAPRSLAVGLHLLLQPDAGEGDLDGEIRRQLRRFEVLRGSPPVHVDGHKHVHARPDVLAALLRVVGPLGLRVRALDAAMRDAIRSSGARACDHLLGDAGMRPCWTPERLAGAFRRMAPGSTEVMMHPGHRPTHAATSFGVEREAELAAAVSPSARAAAREAGVTLAGELPAPSRG